MVNKKVPEYLCNMVPMTVGARANYNLRNAGNLSLVKANHVKTYNSFIPKQWNALGNLRNCSSVDGFKIRYKNQNFRRPTPTYNIERRNAKNHWTRFCHLESEPTLHTPFEMSKLCSPTNCVFKRLIECFNCRLYCLIQSWILLEFQSLKVRLFNDWFGY